MHFSKERHTKQKKKNLLILWIWILWAWAYERRYIGISNNLKVKWWFLFYGMGKCIRKRKEKKEKTATLAQPHRHTVSWNEAKKTKKKSFSTETTERYQIIFRIHSAMHTIFLSTVCLFFCVFIFWCSERKKRKKYQRRIAIMCFELFFFSRFHAALCIVVFSCCFNPKYTSRERETDWRIVFFVLFKRKISIKLYLARMLYTVTCGWHFGSILSPNISFYSCSFSSSSSFGFVLLSKTLRMCVCDVRKIC